MQEIAESHILPENGRKAPRFSGYPLPTDLKGKDGGGWEDGEDGEEKIHTLSSHTPHTTLPKVYRWGVSNQDKDRTINL
jgi:hypothetical protein